MKNFNASIEDCTSALELDETYLKAVLRRAQSYMDLDMFDKAIRDYELAYKLDSGNPEVIKLLRQAKYELTKPMQKDYYKILGLSKDASDDSIKKAYRQRARVHHPGK